MKNHVSKEKKQGFREEIREIRPRMQKTQKKRRGAIRSRQPAAGNQERPENSQGTAPETEKSESPDIKIEDRILPKKEKLDHQKADLDIVPSPRSLLGAGRVDPYVGTLKSYSVEY